MVNFFIERPIFASSLAVIMVLAGLIAYFNLPVSQFPQITPPQVLVRSQYTGASAQVVADTVTTPLEQQINGAEGMIYISSVSANDGSSTITVTFNTGYDVNIGAVDVQNRVSQATAQLPSIVNQTGITIQKQNPNFIMAVNLYSPDGSIDPVTLSNYAYLQLLDPIKRLPGVSDVTIFGERRYAMRIWLDPNRLAKLGMTATDVANAISEQNIQVAAGQFGQSPAPPGTTFTYQINAQGQLATPQQFGNIVLRAGTANTAAVYLRDVAKTELGALQYTSSAAAGSHPAVILAVFQLPTANALALDRSVRATMAGLAARFPKGIAWGVNYDTTMFVAASMSEVMKTLGIALVLVLGVVFLFLQRWRTTRAAEAQLHEASAQIGVATANMLPQLTLSGSIGSETISTLFSPGSLVFSAGAALAQPLFEGGTLLHQRRAAVAAFDVAAAQYRQAVVSAFQNVADTLRALQTDADAVQAQAAAVQAAAQRQFHNGAINYLSLLTAQQTYQQARLSLVQAQAARFADTAALFQALGGGWWNRTDVAGAGVSKAEHVP